MKHLGKVKPGSTIYCYFDTYDGGTGASITLTGLATTDIEIYKDGSNTTRASDSGYALLGTDGIDEFGTGVHGFSVNLADNAAANFYEAGSHYVIVIASVTVDAQTVNFIYGDFWIGYDGAALDTTIATLATQTSFTLEEGPAEDNALNGAVCIIHDLASAVQAGFAVVSAYTGATKTVTLVAGTTFTAAAGDNISFYPPTNVAYWLGTAPAAPTVAGVPEVDLTHIAGSTVATGSAQLGVNVVNAAGTAWGSGAITAASIATGAIDADALATDAVAEIADGVWDEAMSGHLTVGTYGQWARANGLTGEVNDAGATTTVFIVDGFTEATADHFNGSIIVFTSGACLGQARTIADYSATTQQITLRQALTDAPADNDDFVIIPGPYAGGTLADKWMQFVTTLSAAGLIQSGTFGAGAIDAAAIASNAIDADALASDAVDEIWAKALSDLAAVPASTASVLAAINFMFMAARNVITQTSTTTLIKKDDGTTTMATSTVSEAAGTYTRGEFA